MLPGYVCIYVGCTPRAHLIPTHGMPLPQPRDRRAFCGVGGGTPVRSAVRSGRRPRYVRTARHWIREVAAHTPAVAHIAEGDRCGAIPPSLRR
jgi:hypothetical protein